MDRGARRHLHDRGRDRAGSVVAATASAVLIVGDHDDHGRGGRDHRAFNVKDWGKFAVLDAARLLYVAAGVICF